MSRFHISTVVPGYIVSTVDLEMRLYNGRYETLVLPAIGSEVSDWGEVDGTRYDTEAEAVAGHAEFVRKWGGA